MPRMRVVLFAAALSLVAASAAIASRDPSPEERTAVEAALKKAGFSKWGEIKFADDVWQIDDAVFTDGKVYAVDMKPGTFDILDKDVNND